MVLLIRVPNPTEYAALPHAERERLYLALKDLIARWALIELEERIP